MLNQSTTQTPIAVRLYDNQTYGSTYGKGLYRKALFNGTIETDHAKETYLVDFYNYEDWCNQAKTDAQMDALANIPKKADHLYSWIKHYDRSSKGKTLVLGASILDLETYEIEVCIIDPAHDTEEEWILQSKPCRVARSGVKSPQLLATNTDLSTW